jgi:hypothetical protein
MEHQGSEIIVKRELSELDNLVMDFVKMLTNHNIKYVITIGYPETIYGRNRLCKDIEILIRSITFEKFLKLWLELENSYECLNIDDPVDAYNGYLRNHHAIRIIKNGTSAPVVVLRFVKSELDRALLKYRKKVSIDDKILFISSLETLIPYKLFSGVEVDIEDAKFLYKRFKKELNTALFERYLKDLEIPEESVRKYIEEK